MPGLGQWLGAVEFTMACASGSSRLRAEIAWIQGFARGLVANIAGETRSIDPGVIVEGTVKGVHAEDQPIAGRKFRGQQTRTSIANELDGIVDDRRA